MSHQLNQRELILHLDSGEIIVQPIPHRLDDIHVFGPVDYGWAAYKSASRQGGIPDVFTWGGGPLAGSRIPGTRRLVFCAYSPAWEGFYVSSLGGGAHIMHRIGVDYVSLLGQAQQDSVLILNHKNGEITARLEPIKPDILWVGYADPEGQRLFGFYALQQAVFDRYSSEYSEDWVRVMAVGPASRLTKDGIIGSNQIKKGRILPIDDWAGRGGLGSRLLQHHRIAAVIFGGDWDDPDLKDSKEIDGYFKQYYGDSMIKVDLGATEKYRYVPGFMTGGTFGTNMHTANEKLFSFNYTSLYHSPAERIEQHETYISRHYLQQFNEEIIQPRNFAHCGEPCSVACKKYNGIYKKDYEPYEALGPQCGIFDQRGAEELNHFVDALGVDAIQYGGMIAWVMELIAVGLLPAADFNLPPRSELKFEFASRPENFNVVLDSQKNARYALDIASMIMFDEAGEVFRQGLRQAAAALSGRYGADVGQSAVYNSHGAQGCLTPNQYWTPGMLSPMPMMGKYFVYYGYEYLPPKLLGKRCVERMVYELYSENSGVCRFHRKWVEAIVDEIIESHYKVDLDYKAHQFKLVRQIWDQEHANIVFWESERTIDIIWKYLEGWANVGLHDAPEPGERSLAEWLQFFQQDKRSASKAYWDAIRRGIEEAIIAGPQAIADNMAPFQSAENKPK